MEKIAAHLVGVILYYVTRDHLILLLNKIKILINNYKHRQIQKRQQQQQQRQQQQRQQQQQQQQEQPIDMRDAECSICCDSINKLLDELNKYSAVIFNCNHQFHKICIQRCIIYKEMCPNCRRILDNHEINDISFPIFSNICLI